jgi:hypothetical protein
VFAVCLYFAGPCFLFVHVFNFDTFAPEAWLGGVVAVACLQVLADEKRAALLDAVFSKLVKSGAIETTQSWAPVTHRI